jgi:hypothetical protein
MRFETRWCVERPALGGDVCGSFEVRVVKCSVEHDQFGENRENGLSWCGVRSRSVLVLVLFEARIAFTKRAAKLPALSESSGCQASRHPRRHWCLGLELESGPISPLYCMKYHTVYLLVYVYICR